MNRSLLFIFILVFVGSAVFYQASQQRVPQRGTQPAPPTPTATSGTVGRYIRAIQTQDLKTVIDLTAQYQAEAAQIKANNPQVLWDKLIGEYYDKKRSALGGGRQDFWTTYFQALGGLLGDPTQAVRGTMAYLPPNAQWTISETRSQGTVPAQTVITYVTVRYALIDTAPIVEANVLKETILEFHTAGNPSLVEIARRVPQADKLWAGDSSTEFDVARRLTAGGQIKEAIMRLENLDKNQALPPEGRKLLASFYDRDVRANRLDAFSDWKRKIDRALALDPDLLGPWVDFLVELGRKNLAIGAEAALAPTRLTNEYAVGHKDLEEKAKQLSFDVANAYLTMAKQAQDSGFAGQYLFAAIQLAPSEAPARAVEIIEFKMEAVIARHDIYATEATENSLESWLGWMEAMHLSIPPEHLPTFLNFAKGTRSPERWNGRIRKLASSRPDGPDRR